MGFRSLTAGKHKWHLCVSAGGCFLYLNSPKERAYAGDLEIDCSALAGVPPTESGKSIIACSAVVRMSERQLTICQARRVGRASVEVLRELLDHVLASRVLSREEKAIVTQGLASAT